MISATLCHCLDDTIGSSLVLDRLKGPDYQKLGFGAPYQVLSWKSVVK